MADADVNLAPLEHPDEGAERPAMTSRQKIAAMLGMLDGLEPADAQGAAVLLGVTMLRPQVEAMLPEDPAELDRLLLIGANWAVRLRSDDAPRFHVVPAEVVSLEPEPGA